MSRRVPLASAGLRLVSDQPAPRTGQMSHANGFAPGGGRGRGRVSARRVSGRVSGVGRVALPVADAGTKAAFCAAWSGLMADRFGATGREACAAVFGVTFQTACNWYDALSCPTGDKVALASIWWPEAYDRFIGRVA